MEICRRNDIECDCVCRQVARIHQLPVQDGLTITVNTNAATGRVQTSEE